MKPNSTQVELSRDQISYMPNKEWFTLPEACKLKGLNIKTAYNNRWLMPNHGIYEGKIGGRQCFKRDTITNWLKITDDIIELEYLKRCTDSSIPPEIKNVS